MIENAAAERKQFIRREIGFAIICEPSADAELGRAKAISEVINGRQKRELA